MNGVGGDPRAFQPARELEGEHQVRHLRGAEGRERPVATLALEIVEVDLGGRGSTWLRGFDTTGFGRERRGKRDRTIACVGPSRNCLGRSTYPPTPQEQVSWKGSLADPNVAAGYRDPQLTEQAAPLLAVLVVARSETNSTSIGFASRAGVVVS
jgi:hypothetical protein